MAGKAVATRVAAGLRLILLSDGHLLRVGLRSALEQDGMRIVGELDSTTTLVDTIAAKAGQVVVAAPADGGSEEFYDSLSDLPGTCGAVVLLPINGFQIHSRALRRRGLQCLPLDVDADQLRIALRTAAAASPQRSGGVALESVCVGSRGALSHREQQVLRELSHGLTNREIAERLWVTPDTVKSHLRRIFKKLDVNTRTEAVALYLGELRAPQ